MGPTCHKAWHREIQTASIAKSSALWGLRPAASVGFPPPTVMEGNSQPTAAKKPPKRALPHRRAKIGDLAATTPSTSAGSNLARKESESWRTPAGVTWLLRLGNGTLTWKVIGQWHNEAVWALSGSFAARLGKWFEHKHLGSRPPKEASLRVAQHDPSLMVPQALEKGLSQGPTLPRKPRKSPSQDNQNLR